MQNVDAHHVATALILVAINMIPKRRDNARDSLGWVIHPAPPWYSASGEVSRRELRELAKNMQITGPVETRLKSLNRSYIVHLDLTPT